MRLLWDALEIVYWLCVSAQLVMLVRAYRGKFLSKYPWFYTYLAFDFAAAVGMRVARAVHPAFYEAAESPLRFLTMFVACGMFLEIPRAVLGRQQRADNLTRVVWLVFYGVMFWFASVYVVMATLVGCVIVAEILRYVLAPRETPEKFGRLLRVGLAAAVFCGAVAYMHLPALTGAKGPYVARLVLQRDFQLGQAIFMLGIVAGLYCYGIRLGRNLKGMFAGYGVYVATTLVMYTLRLWLGRPPFQYWLDVPPVAYDACIMIWLASLWSYDPNPPSPLFAEVRAEGRRNYEGTTAHVLRAIWAPSGLGRWPTRARTAHSQKSASSG